MTRMRSRFRVAAARFWHCYWRALEGRWEPEPDTSQPRYQPRHDGNQAMVGPEYDPRSQIFTIADKVKVTREDVEGWGTSWAAPVSGVYSITAGQRPRLIRAADDTLTGELPAIGTAVADRLLGGISTADTVARFADMAAGRRGAGPSRDFLLPWSVPS